MANNSNKNFNNWKKQLEEAAEFQKKLNSGMSEYLSAIKDIDELQKQINHGKKVMVEMDEEIKKLKQEEKAIYNSISKESNPAIIKQLEKQLALTKAKIKAERVSKKLLDDELVTLQKTTDEYSKQVKEANKLAIATKSIAKGLMKAPAYIKKGYGELKNTGIFEMDKEIRNAARSMGVGNKQYDAFSKTMMNAAASTTMMGVNIKDLAKMQQNYSEEIGRSVILSERGLEAMAGMAEGTGLGTEFAAQMASSMDNFGVSVESSAKVVEETMNTADKFGVNAAKAVKSMHKNLKLAQRFHFKGGVNSLMKMSIEAERLKLDLDGIAGMAEKVFRPEGAIEMAAQLATMGGNFAKLGDPMQLMFKARNDFEGFAKDIGKASAEFVEFNKENGEFEIKGGLAADRMREISKITGISVEKLQEMAVQQKKIEQMGAIMPFSMDEDSKKFIASKAFLNKDKQWVINLDGKEELVKNLSANDERIKAEEQSLKERAKQARTFDEVLGDLMISFKTLLLPIAEGLKAGLGTSLQGFMKEFGEDGKGWKELVEFGKSIGQWLKDLGGPDGIGGAITNLGKWLQGENLKMAGALLGAGFIAGVVGKFLSPLIKVFTGFKRLFSWVGKLFGGGGFLSSILGNTGKKTAASTAANVGKNVIKGGKAFTALGLTSIAADVGRSYMDDPNSDLGKGIGIAGSTAEYAGYGALLGSIVPGVGNVVGGIVGGGVGLGKGVYDEYFSEEAQKRGKVGRENTSTANKGIPVDDGIIFNPKDKFVKLNDALIAGTNVGGNRALADAILSTVGNSSNIDHKFDDMKINININANGLDNDIASNLLRKSDFINNIQTEIQKAIRMNLGGGKLNPNPLRY